MNQNASSSDAGAHPPLFLTLLTGSRLVLALGVAILTPWLREQVWAILLATGLILLIELTDLADGYLARRHGAVSQFGKLFDPYTDSLARITIYWSLAVAGRCLAVVPLLMAIRDITVGYTRILMLLRGMDPAARWWGKLKAIIQAVGALVLASGPLWWGRAERGIIYGVSVIVIVATLLSAVFYANEALRKG